MTPKEKVEEIMKDWVDGRDTEAGVTFNKKVSRIGWESRTDGRSFSSYFFGTRLFKDRSDEIAKAYRLGKNFVSAMGIGRKTSIRIHTDKNCTDGRVIYVSTAVFDETKLSTNEKSDVFLGEVVHEASHIKYTDFKHLENFNAVHESKLKRGLWNIIEDEQIELNLSEHYPGYVHYIQKAKYYIFNKALLETFKKGKKHSKLEKAMSSLFACVRYPKHMKKSDIEENVDFLFECKKILTPYPKNSVETSTATLAIYELLKELYKEDIEKREKEERTEKELVEEMEKLAEDFVEALMKSLDIGVLDINHPKTGKTQDRAESVIKIPFFGEMMEGTVEISGVNTFFQRATEDEYRYKQVVDKIYPHAATISKILKLDTKDYRIHYKSMRSGYLDTGKLAEAVQGVDTIYERYADVVTQEVAVVLLIDQSGSMGGSSIKAAQECAILFNEALKKVNKKELFIYGHNADIKTDPCTQIYIYKEPGIKNPFTLGSVRSGGCNRDGVAIEEVAKRVRRFTQSPCIFFVLSDGAPSATGYGGSAGITHTKEMVLKTERMGFHVIQIAIEPHVPSDQMFSKWVLLTDIGNLAHDLGLLMKKTVRKMSKIKTVTH
jgi:hypothetical protein